MKYDDGTLNDHVALYCIFYFLMFSTMIKIVHNMALSPFHESMQTFADLPSANKHLQYHLDSLNHL